MDNDATRNIFSVGSAMKYAGISDFEFIKAFTLFDIIILVLQRF